MHNTITLAVAIVLSMLFAAADCAWAVPITGGTGPGGIGTTDGTSSLRLWVRGDQGVQTTAGDVTQWDDQSGYANNLTPAATSNAPSTGTKNGLGTVVFDDTNTEFLLRASSGTAVGSGSFVLGGTGTATFFTVYLQNNSQDGLPFLARNTDLPSGSLLGFHSNAAGPPFPIRTFPTGGTGITNINGTPGGTLALSTYGVVNGATIGSTETTAAYTDLTFGSDAGSTGRLLNGEIAEAAIFNTTLNNAQRRVIDNALSAKYDVPLTVGNIYEGDDLAFGDYDSDVFGVARIDASNEHNNGGQAGFGIEATSGLENGDSLMAGNKTPTNGLTEDGDFVRWERVWYLDKTDPNDSVNAAFSFNTADAGISTGFGTSLLYSPSDPYNFSELATGTFVGDLITFNLSGSEIASGYYTLGVPVPEPSTFLLLGLGALGLVRHTRRRGRRA